MHFKFRHLQKIVGGFFLLTVVIIVALLVIVARGQRWFQEYVPYECYFAGGGGIQTGAEVMIHGLIAGKVEGVGLTDDNRVRFRLGLFKHYAGRLTEGTLVQLVSPVIGSSRLEIVLGPQDAPRIKRGGTIPSKTEEGGGLDELIEMATALIKSLENPQGDLMQTLANVNKATKDVAVAIEGGKGKKGLLDELSSVLLHLDNVLAVLDASSPDVRDAISEARQGLDEANKLILALQKSIFIRGNMEKYLKEDSTLRVEGRAATP